MTTGTTLDRLCAHYHIASEYQDIWGRRREVSRETRRALLAGMGVPAGDDAALEQALAAAEAARWRRLLPPVRVAWEDEAPLTVVLGLPATHLEQRHAWRLTEENGAVHEGEVTPGELPRKDSRELDDGPWEQRLLELPAGLPPGYHRLEVGGRGPTDSPPASMSLIVAPRHCYRPWPLRDDGRVWGLSLQLYAVRSTRNWGIGDFTDLIRVVEFAAQAGAGLVGVSPLHALFPHDPEHASPYSPSSRLFLNTLYLDVEAVPEFRDCEEARHQVADEAFQARLRALRAAEMVDYAGVAALKGGVLATLYRHFRRHHLETGSPRAEDFRRYREEQGTALVRHTLHEALQGWLYEQDPEAWGWPAWPARYRHPEAPAVEAFAAEQAERVEFYQYLQWLAHEQLRAVGQRAYDLGLGVGLYQDLAVSVDAGGAEAWADQDLYAVGARIGSPPDDFNLRGQDWGLPPWNPERLQERAYEPFITTLRRNMQDAGMLRIDHVMALMRLYWVPPGHSPLEGGYVGYPFEDLLGILALESRRNQCLVVGEDLGTVPDEVRAALPAMGVLSYRLLYFEKDAKGAFKAPPEFETETLVAVSTHDLPTLAGYWQGRDLELRDRLHLFPGPEQRERQMIGRAEDRARLLMALEREDLLPAGTGVQPVGQPDMTPGLMEAVHRYLARTPARVMVVRMEDVLGQHDQVNLPGTHGEHPNWRRKLALDLECWDEEARILALVSALRAERGRAVQRPAQPLVPHPAITRTMVPRGTYRLQFHRDFTFADGEALVPYLDALGVSHCYASPCLQARPGSTHGYDIIDHTTVNTELGGDDGFARFADALVERGMGQVMDMVPNHMGVMGGDNGWWLDVLENGRASPWAAFFDIDWSPLKEGLRDKVLLPVLGDRYGAVLENGELTLSFDGGGGSFCVRYYEHVFPVDPAEYPRILAHEGHRLEERLGAGDPRLREFQSLVTAFGNLPPRSADDSAAMTERRRDKELHKATLARLAGDADIARYLEENLEAFNDPGRPDVLHQLLEHQAWRLAWWRVATDEINYRRFFDINELAGLRMERPEVFEATHGRIMALIGEGRVHGLRIDHPDGLYDPVAYFERLQERVSAPVPAAGDPASDGEAEVPARPLYLLVEKILAGHERLRGDWAVHGTTGYDFTNLVNGVFVDAAAEDPMDRTYHEFMDRRGSLDEMIYQTKQLIMRTSLASELNVLSQQLSRIAELERHTRDYTLISLHQALSGIVACFPVYRTYVRPGVVAEEDRRYVDWAVNVAKKRSTAADTSVFDFVRDVLLTDIAEGRGDDYRRRVTTFAMRFQQYTGPVMAKGLEDTAFYRYHRLVSLNEVGGEPGRFGTSVAAFHHQNQERARLWPHAMLATATHDSKRGEDVRARIDVLSEVPDEWRTRVGRWSRLNRDRKREVDGRPAPSANDEYLLYQTLVGTWPLTPPDETQLSELRERVRGYMDKAIKEAKVHTSWVNADEDYEAATAAFVDALLSDPERNAFLADFGAFLETLGRSGLVNGLAQALLKLTAPGVPDIYQGTELWDLSLVDPDNRRPVDYPLRNRQLEALQGLAGEAGADLAGLAGRLVADLEDGRAKLYLTWRALELRRDRPALFRDGDYEPLAVAGRHADHLCAFARHHQGARAVTVVPRLVHRLAGGAVPLGAAAWEDTRVAVPAGTWDDRLSGRRLTAGSADGRLWLAAAELFEHFPVALLARDGDAP